MTMKTWNFSSNGVCLALLVLYLTGVDNVYGQLDTISFLSAQVDYYSKCIGLCTAYKQCDGADFNATDQSCFLYTQNLLNMVIHQPAHNNYYSSNTPGPCDGRPCRDGEVCVVTTSGSGHICLLGNRCNSPPALSNMASMSSTSLFPGAEVTYSCNHGYTPSGDGLSVCLGTGEWSTPSLTCTVVDCGSPASLSNMVTGSVTSTTYNSAVVYSCDVGYTGTGDGTSTCLGTGVWSTTALTCQLVDCGSPSALTNMNPDPTSVTSTTYQSAIMYQCDSGYTVTSGTGDSQCLHMGSWSPPSLLCQSGDCGSPPSLTNMNPDPTSVTSTTYQSAIMYQCDIGYTVTSGTGDSQCLISLTWSTPTLHCQIVDCGSPSSLANMVTGSVTSTTYNSAVVYSCDVGYTGTGDGTSTCEGTGLWSTPALTCQLVDCGSPPSLANMVSGSVTSTTYNSAVVYSCDVGYTGTGDGTSTCEGTGLWSTPTLACQLVDCGSPSSLANMVTGSVTSTTYNSAVVYSCDVGYTGTGDGTSTCEGTGLWSTPALTCQPLTTTLILTTALILTTLWVVVVCVVLCPKGYVIGAFHAPVVDCGSPSSLANMVTGSVTSTTYNSAVVYSCNPGYTGTGDGTSTCEGTGLWSTPALTCQLKPGVLGGARSGTGSSLNCVNKELTAANSPLACDDGQVLIQCSVAEINSPFDGGAEIVNLGSKMACKLHTNSGDVEKASVRCCTLQDLECEYHRSGTPAITDDTGSQLTCPSGYYMIGCTAHTEGSTKMDGVRMTLSDCQGWNGVNSGAVYSSGTCCRAPTLSCSYSQIQLTDANLQNQCSGSQVLTGCVGFHWWGSSKGYYISDSTGVSICHVPNQGHPSNWLDMVCCSG